LPTAGSSMKNLHAYEAQSRGQQHNGSFEVSKPQFALINISKSILRGVEIERIVSSNNSTLRLQTTIQHATYV